MAGPRKKGMKRSHMKRFASDNIQIKSATRHKAAMQMRQHHINPKPFAITPDKEAYLNRIFPGVVVMTSARKIVLLELQTKMLQGVNPERSQVLLEGKLRSVVMVFNDNMSSVHLIETNHSIKKVRKSLTYSCRHKIKKEYLDGTIQWRPYTPIPTG